MENHHITQKPYIFSGNFALAEIPLDITSMSIAIAYVTTRYPTEGYSCLTSDMVVAVLSGKGWLHRAGNVQTRVKPGDIISIKKGEEYFWEVEGKKQLRLLAINSPPFNPNDRKTK